MTGDSGVGFTELKDLVVGMWVVGGLKPCSMEDAGSTVGPGKVFHSSSKLRSAQQQQRSGCCHHHVLMHSDCEERSCYCSNFFLKFSKQ